jgi:hypothetical protein
MKVKHYKKSEKSIVKICLFCDKVFYAKRDTAKYCSDLHKVKFHNWIKWAKENYYDDPNEGKVIPPGTITSWNMPEDKVILSGNKESLINVLSEKLSEIELANEILFIENLIPFSVSSAWLKSSIEIFTDNEYIEIIRVLPDQYKLYFWACGEDNEYPFK